VAVPGTTVDQGHVEAEDRRAQRTRQRRDSGLVPVLLVMGTMSPQALPLRSSSARM
jgi:hypothetical protein